MRRLTFGAATAVLLLTAAGCGSSDNGNGGSAQSNAAAHGMTVHDTAQYSIALPDGWSVSSAPSQDDNLIAGRVTAAGPAGSSGESPTVTIGVQRGTVFSDAWNRVDTVTQSQFPQRTTDQDQNITVAGASQAHMSESTLPVGANGNAPISPTKIVDVVATKPNGTSVAVSMQVPSQQLSQTQLTDIVQSLKLR